MRLRALLAESRARYPDCQTMKGTAMVDLWRGFANMAATAGHEIVIDRGQSATVWDADGKEYLDSTASLWYMNVGYGRTEIVDAVTEQLGKLPAFHTFGSFANQPALDLAAKLSSLAPMEDAAVFFTAGGGSESVDTAAKLARRYFSATGKPEKQTIISREHAYHGVNGFGTSLQGIPGNRAGYGDLIPGVVNLPHDSPAALEEYLHAHADTTAAFIGEPVIGAGGVIPPPEDYWPQVQELCRKYNILLISDEVICGFGRLGTWFGCQRFGVEPDLMCCAKGLTSGYQPLGAVVIGPRVRAAFWEGDGAELFRHGYTYGGHPAACAAGLANLAIIEREDLLGRVRALEPVLDETFREQFEGHPLVREVRAIGLAASVQLTDSLLRALPQLPSVIDGYALSHGLITRPLRNVAMQVSPPFVSTEAEIREMGRRMRLAFDDTLANDVPQELLAAV